MLLVPAGIERDFAQGKVCVGDRLPGMLSTIAILVDHDRPAPCDLHSDQHKPILRANLTQMAGHSIHHPKASALFCQVLGAVCEQVPPADSVVATRAGELSQCAAVQAQLLEFLLCLHLCAFHLCGCDHSLLSDAHLGNQRLVTRELGGVPG